MSRPAVIVFACLLASITPIDAEPAMATPSPLPASSTVAQRNFLQFCSGCHLADGAGSPGKGIPSMNGTLGLWLQVQGGREFIVQVPGVMNSGLKDRQVAELMNWLVPHFSSQTMPAGMAPYTEDEIARLRRLRPVDPLAVRRALLARATASGLDMDAAYAASAQRP